MATVGTLNQTNLTFKNAGNTELLLDASGAALTFNNASGTTLAKLTAAANQLTLNGSTGGTTVQVSQVTNPVNPQDAATKSYVDNAVQGLTWKTAVQNGTTANIVLGALGNSSQTATATIDGTTFTVANVGVRLLVKNQTSQSAGNYNGIYVLALCTNTAFFYWTPASDALSTDSAAGAAMFITNGTANADTAWVCSTTAPVNFQSAPLTFVQFSSGGGSAVGPTNAIQISANGTGSFAGYSDFTFNQSTSAPDLEIGSDSTSTSATLGVGTGTTQTTSTLNVGTSSAQTTAVVNVATTNNAAATVNMSQGTGTTTMNAKGTGLFSIVGSGAFTQTALNTAAVNLFNTTTSGNITLGSILTGQLSLGNASSSGSIVFNGATATTLTSLGPFTSTGPVGSNVQLFNTTTTGAISMGTSLTSASSLTLGLSTGSGALALAGTTGTTLTSLGPVSGTAPVGSAITLFNTTTTGAISMGTAVTNASSVTLGNTAGSGSLVLSGSSGTTLTSTGNFTALATAGATIALFNTVTTTGTISMGGALTTGTFTLGNSGMTGNITLNNNGTMYLGNGNSTTIYVGGTSTTASNILATGVSGTIVMTSGAGTGAGAGGAISITSGAGGTTGNGAAVGITAGAAGSTSGTGGSVNLTAGAGTGTAGVGGNVAVKSAAGTTTNGNTQLFTASHGTATGSLTTGIVGFYDSLSSLKARVEDDGQMYALAFNATSDATHKTNIEELSGSLGKIKRIRGYQFDWKDSFNSNKNKRTNFGVLAQELEANGLDLLVNGSEGNKTVNYNGIIALLIGSINELSAKVEKLERGESDTDYESESDYI